LKKEPLLIILERKELESFLTANDLQQNDQVDNVISIDKRMVVFSRKIISAGEGQLISDVGKMSDEMVDFILSNASQSP
jgi:hypothetical protein